MMLTDNAETMQIPSDLKPGTYILRTELLALHGNSPMMASGPLGGPQFYPHCFNVEISGTGTSTPEGVTIPGAYKQKDFSVSLDVWGKPAEHVKYVSKENTILQLVATYTKIFLQLAPGPPLYQGKHDAPAGSPAVVKETGAFPAELRKRYDDLAASMESLSRAIINFVNAFDYGKSRTRYPTAQETKEMISKVGAEMGKLPKFYTDLEALKKDYARATAGGK